jgi:hypothetical protein
MNDVKVWLRGIFGVNEDTSGTVSGLVSQLAKKKYVYTWPEVGKALAFTANWPHPRLAAQTGSLSATQPLAERTIFVADKKCRVKEIYFTQAHSSTVSTSATTSWTLLILKRGGSNNTMSTTVSVTSFVGGLCSMSAGQPGFSNSYSQLAYNVAHKANPLLITTSTTKPLLYRGNILTAQVKKGASGVATSNGAQFPGGEVHIVVEEE